MSTVLIFQENLVDQERQGVPRARGMNRTPIAQAYARLLPYIKDGFSDVKGWLGGD